MAVVPPGGGIALTVGFLAVLLGAWGGIVPFVAPIFGFSADGAPSFDWTLSHALLFLVPGAAAVLMGLVMAGTAPALSRGLPAGGPGMAGLVMATCGAWFVIGPLAWPVLEAVSFFSPATPLRELGYWVAYSLGPGVLLATLGGTAIGVAAKSRRSATATHGAGVTSSGVSIAA